MISYDLLAVADVKANLLSLMVLRSKPVTTLCNAPCLWMECRSNRTSNVVTFNAMTQQ